MFKHYSELRNRTINGDVGAKLTQPYIHFGNAAAPAASADTAVSVVATEALSAASSLPLSLQSWLFCALRLFFASSSLCTSKRTYMQGLSAVRGGFPVPGSIKSKQGKRTSELGISCTTTKKWPNLFFFPLLDINSLHHL